MKQVLYAIANLLSEMNGKQHSETMVRLMQDLLIAINRTSGPKVRALVTIISLVADMTSNDS